MQEQQTARHAYCIVTNGNFGVLRATLALVDDPRNDIYILLDKKAKAKLPALEALVKELRYSSAAVCLQTVNWGGITQVYAVLALLKAALAAKRDYRYIHFFQGADLPIKTQDAIHEYFAENDGREFVEIDRSRMEMAKNKCHYRHFFCHNRYFRKNRLVKAINFGLVYVQRLLRICKNTDITLYHGSALFSLTEGAAEYLLGREKEIRRRFRLALAPDEVFIQTILMDSPYRDKIMGVAEPVSDNARLIDRTRPDGKNSPHVWRSGEVAQLLSQPRGKCFARKFDEKVDLAAAIAVENAILNGG